MKLLKLSYKDNNWQLSDLTLGKLNLIVAKNATGKSRTLQTIDLLVKMITQKRDLNWGSRWDLTFLNHQGQSIVFSFATQFNGGGVVSAEKITVDEKVVLFRDYKKGQVVLHNYLTHQRETIYPPANKFTLHTNRDVKKYPYLEEIVAWAEQSYGFKFGNISPYAKLNEQEYDLLTAVEDIPNLFRALGKEVREEVLHAINEIGYEVTNIFIQDKVAYIILYIKEIGVNKALPHYKLSQGMFRALSIIIYFEYLISRKKPALIIIDDFCEGLDYERAKKLGQWVFEKCENSEIQLVVTSNDSFLMDIVDIKHWNLLKREGKLVTAMSVQNHAEIFRKFRLTGLSNFDFFASDFLQQQEL